jgi:hypothetical protein
MGYWSAEDLPFHAGLARTFPLAEHTGAAGLHVARALTLLARRLLPGLEQDIRGELQCTANLYPLGLARTIGHLRHIERFFQHAAAGTLPPVSIVDPDFEVYSEENPRDIRLGEGFRQRGHQRRYARPGLATHPAHLALQRTRRILRPRTTAATSNRTR